MINYPLIRYKCVVTVLLILTSGFSFSQLPEYPIVNFENESYAFDTEVLCDYIVGDSIMQAVFKFNDSISNKYFKNKPVQTAKIYNNLGYLYNEIGNFKGSEVALHKAYKISKEYKDLRTQKNALYNLGNNYILTKRFEKFDSLYPILSELSSKKKTVHYYLNKHLNALRLYENYQFVNLYSVTERYIKELEVSNFLNNYPNTRLKLLYELRLFNAYALVNLKIPIGRKKLVKKGYKRLVTIQRDSLRKYLINDLDYELKMALYHYYVYRYYSKKNPIINSFNADSALYHLHKSDAFKFFATSRFKNKIANDGSLIYDTLQNNEKLKSANEASKIYFITVIFSIILIIVLTGFVYYYYRSRNKLLKVDKDRNAFFSILSHELRTPIYGINGLAELIEKESNPNKKDRYFRSIKISAKHISLLIDNVLQASRYKYIEKHLNESPTKFDEFINDLNESIQFFATSRKINFLINKSLNKSNELLNIDTTALNQVLINLIYNAIKFTPEGNNVTLNVSEYNRTKSHVDIYFDVSDQGVGLPDNFKLNGKMALNVSSLSSQNQGTGLGLKISQMILKSFNSKLFFISEKGEGTSFYFKIRFKISELLNETEDLQQDDINKTSHKINILVVDDNKINTLVTKKNIEKLANTNCDVVYSGSEAIKRVKKNTYKVVFMDINMPIMNGYEATKLIKKIKPKTVVIALTALNFAEVKMHMQDSGMDDIITKPYDLAELKKKIYKYTKKTSQPELKLIS